jgi:hypothetical protein
MALSLFVAFAVAAGFGFGLALGIGVLASSGKLSIRTSAENTSEVEDENGLLRNDEIVVAPASQPDASPKAAVALPPEAGASAPPETDLSADVRQVRLDLLEVPSNKVMSQWEGAELFAGRKLDAAPSVILDFPQRLAPPAVEEATLQLPAVSRLNDAGPQGQSLSTVPPVTPPVDRGFLGGGGDPTLAPEEDVEFFMHVPSGVSSETIRGLVSRLEGNGVKIEKIGRESFRVSTTHLRYYSPETAERAKSVASELGVEARDFSQNVVADHRIEIWIAGRAGSGGARSQSRQERYGSSGSSYGGSGGNR